MRPVRPGPLAAVLTGLGLSAIVGTGGLLAGGFGDVGRTAPRAAPDGPAITLATAPAPRDEPREAAAEPLRRASRTPVATDLEDRPRLRARPRRDRDDDAARRSEPVATVRPLDATHTPPAARTPQTTAVPEEATPEPAPTASAAARRVSLRLDDLRLEPATTTAAGRLRLRVAVAEEPAPDPAALPGDDVAAAEQAGAVSGEETRRDGSGLPGTLEVVLAVAEAPPGTSIRVSLDLRREAAGPADLRVQVTFAESAAGDGATVADSAPASDGASNTLDVRAPLDVATTTFSAREPEPEGETAPARPTTDVVVPVAANAGGDDAAQVVEIPVAAPAAQPEETADEPAGEPGSEPADEPADEDMVETVTAVAEVVAAAAPALADVARA